MTNHHDARGSSQKPSSHKISHHRETPSITYQQIQDRLNHRFMHVIDALDKKALAQQAQIKKLDERIDYLERVIHDNMDC